LFAGNDGGARHWAIAMTTIQTAKLNGVDLMAYLTDVLERIVSGRTKAHELQTLLRWNWKASLSGTTIAQAAWPSGSAQAPNFTSSTNLSATYRRLFLPPVVA
jgi:transposase IS66-like protein